jgi:dishevelled associated activator of morphogenesis
LLTSQHDTNRIAKVSPENFFSLDPLRIHHYEQRLRSLHYKKKFSVTLNDLLPRIASVMEASREVARSRRLRKLLELVLALGNYMNRGARGNAFGFRLQSLNRLADTKASSAKAKGTTLLHYLVQIIEAKFKDILRLEEDMPHIKEASKVSLGEMDKDIGNLRTGIAEVAREIEFHRSAGSTLPGDRFLPVMRDFHAQASIRFAELEDKFQDMKTR